MKKLIFSNESPVQILDKSYVTNIQMECQTVKEALDFMEEYINKDWSNFSISRGGNVTVYTGYNLTSIVLDFSSPFVIHFILEQMADIKQDSNMEEYVEAAKILLGEAI